MTDSVVPRVSIEERSEALIVAGPITVGNIGIVGTAQKGPIGEVQILSSFADAVEIFGAYDDFSNPDNPGHELTLVRALELAYANGASTVYAIRVSQTSSTNPGTGDEYEFIKPWSEYTLAKKAVFNILADDNTEVAKLRAITQGKWGNEILINVTNADTGSIVSNEEVDTKSGSFTLKRHTINKGDGGNQIKLVSSVGVVTSFIVDYDGTPTTGHVVLNPTTGDLEFAAGEKPTPNDKLYASYVVPKDSSRKVTIKYGGVIETYTVADGQHLLDQVSGSRIVEGIEKSGILNKLPKKDDDTGQTFQRFDGGDNGAAAERDGYSKGLDQLLIEEVHIVLVAGQSDPSIGNALASHVETASNDTYGRDRIGVIGGGLATDLTKIIQPYDSGRMVFVAPGFTTTDTSGKSITLPGAYSSAAIAGMLSVRQPHISLTNKTVSIDNLELRFDAGQLETLIGRRILALEDRQGVKKVVKAITTSTNTAFQQITTRRIVDYAKYGVRSAADPYIGLLNNDRVRKALKGSINGFLASMVDDEMLISYVLDVTATRDEQIRGIARVTMTIQPTFSIDYIKVVMYLG